MEEIGFKIIMTTKISASFHGKPRNFQRSFYITKKHFKKYIHKVLREGEIGFLDCSHSRRTQIFVHQIQYHFALSQPVRTRGRRLETILSLSLRKLRRFHHWQCACSAFPHFQLWVHGPWQPWPWILLRGAAMNFYNRSSLGTEAVRALLEGLFAQIHIDLSCWVFGRNRTSKSKFYAHERSHAHMHRRSSHRAYKYRE